MARKVELEIEIGPDGKVMVEVKGRKGPSCLEFIEILGNALGAIKDTKYTAEYYEKQEIEQNIHLDQKNK